MAGSTIEISIKGQWVRVPALTVNDYPIVTTGKWIKLAAVHDEDWAEREVEHPEICIKALKDTASQSPRADIFTFTQKPPADVPRYAYPFEGESIAAIRLGSFKEWWESLPQESRKNVRRSQKRGVAVRVKEFDDDLIRGIVEVNNDSPMRQGRRYSHYNKSFEQVKKDHSAFVDRSDFICAYLENEVIGFLKIVYRGDVASILQLTPKLSHSDKRPANAMLAKAIERCEERGISCVTYGLFNYGNKGNTPIREFKVRNGFGEILVPRYYVPLTTWGAVCVRTKLYRGLLGILPQNMIALGVSARAKMYDVKQRMSRCSSTSERPNSDRQMERSTPPAGSNL
jgi:Acetyltransferase (GNAT) domain